MNINNVRLSDMPTDVIGDYAAHLEKHNQIQEASRNQVSDLIDDTFPMVIDTVYDDNVDNSVASHDTPSMSSNSNVDWESWEPFSDYYDTFLKQGDDKDASQYSDYFGFDNMCKSKTVSYDTDTIINGLDNISNTRTCVINNIPNECKESRLLYLCRIYVSKDNMYKYVVGFTKDIEETLESIDDTYLCEWDIEILILTACSSQDEEVVLRYKIYRMGISIDNGLYDISTCVYKLMVIGIKYANPFYAIDCNNNEWYLDKKINNTTPCNNPHNS